MIRRVVNRWNKLPEIVISAGTVNCFKSRRKNAVSGEIGFLMDWSSAYPSAISGISSSIPFLVYQVSIMWMCTKINMQTKSNQNRPTMQQQCWPDLITDVNYAFCGLHFTSEIKERRVVIKCEYANVRIRKCGTYQVWMLHANVFCKNTGERTNRLKRFRSQLNNSKW